MPAWIAQPPDSSQCLAQYPRLQSFDARPPHASHLTDGAGPGAAGRLALDSVGTSAVRSECGSDGEEEEDAGLAEEEEDAEPELELELGGVVVLDGMSTALLHQRKNVSWEGLPEMSVG